MIQALYHDMDTAWNKVAGKYGFTCNGCDDNCCKSLFYHHTHVEKAYLLHGVLNLPDRTRSAVILRARQYMDRLLLYHRPDTPFSMMCPLNLEGRCLVYDHRPMICRLHGIPHELHRPGRPVINGPGCRAGSSLFSRHGYIPFDRTPFYTRMAGIETAFKKTAGKTEHRIKQTVARMLDDLDQGAK